MLKLLWRMISGLLLLLAIPAIYVGFRIFTYSMADDVTHLQAKNAYLAAIAEQSATLVNPPNIVLILLDDLGYGDLGVTGSKAIATPNIDQLANSGVLMTRYYSPAPVCTPARAGILTGRFPLRAGMPQVVFASEDPLSYIGKVAHYPERIGAEEITLANLLTAAGYDTGMVGKWHLGDRSPSLPNDMGFNSYFGSLYSNDMSPFALYRNSEIAIAAPADQTRLNEWYVQEAKAFLAKPRTKPFFLYYAHNFPHIPLHSSAEQQGKSAAGLYGDVVEDVDRGIGEIIAQLQDSGQFDNTLILLTSDNGPWYQGSPADFRGRKADTFEGGMRVPMIVSWPLQIPGGRVVDGLAMGMDIFPSVADWLGLPLPSDRIIDGQSLRGLLEQDQPSPHQYLYYFAVEQLMAVRSFDFKYHARRSIAFVQAATRFTLSVEQGPWLFDMQLDENESYDVAMKYPAKAAELEEAFTKKRSELESNLRGWL